MTENRRRRAPRSRLCDAVVGVGADNSPGKLDLLSRMSGVGWVGAKSGVATGLRSAVLANVALITNIKHVCRTN